MDILEILDKNGLKLASDSNRILAFIIDDFIIGAIVFFAILPQLSNINIYDMEQLSSQVDNIVKNTLLYMIVLMILYHSIFTAIYGASIGKMICKIKIIKLDTLNKPNVMDSIIRSVIRTLSEFLFYIPLLVAFGDPFKRAVHDMLIKSIVIDVSVPQDMQD